MKSHHATLLQIVCFCLVISMVGPVGLAMAGQTCTDLEGFSVACSNHQPTRLDLIEECADIDGFPTTCRNQQAFRIDLVKACTDYEGLSTACGETHKSPTHRMPVLTAQTSL